MCRGYDQFLFEFYLGDMNKCMLTLEHHNKQKIHDSTKIHID